MLNGLDPIIIFNLKKLPPKIADDASIPLVSNIVDAIALPSIPVYLSERISGILIDSEDKSIEVSTETNTTTDGSAASTHQRAISSTINVKMTAKRGLIGAALLAALADLVFPLLTSKEYTITYLHGAITVFNGLLNSFTVEQNPDNDLYSISLSLIKPPAESVKKSITVPKSTDTLPVGAPAIGGGA